MSSEKEGENGTRKTTMTNGDAAATPGDGWTNGSLPPSMFSSTLDGKVALYSSQRRWIGVSSSWTRIGSGSQFDAKHTSSSSGAAAHRLSPEEESKRVRSLVAQLCEKFYAFGWATGTGGGVSIRTGGPAENRPYRVFVAPSGVQKEDMIGDDVFELDMDSNVVVPPETPGLKLSACTPLWYVVYRNRPTARAVIHTHSLNAQMATLLDPTERSKSLKITHLEMLKGVGGHAYDDVLEVPIIDNRPTEDQLADQLDEAVKKYPESNAVLVRRHGLYVWGDSWEQAKTQCESFDYLFESAVRMKSMGIDPGLKPTSGTYREEPEKSDGPPKKRPRTTEGAAKPVNDSQGGGDFNAASGDDNAADLASPIPLLPRDSKALLLDIEGCTTSISFVHDELFPYVLANLDSRVASLPAHELDSLLLSLSGDIDKLDASHGARKECEAAVPTLTGCTAGDETRRDIIKVYVRAMMKFDVKATGLKKLQGEMWKAGYESGELKGHVYPDVLPLFKWCKSQNVSVNIYSSGSVAAQKLLFGRSSEGDLLSYLGDHFDTTSGGKKDAESYRTIAKSMGVDVKNITFVSDAEAELVAAREAGVGNAVMSVRPGNAPLTDVGKEFPIVRSLLQLCGA